MRLFLYEHITGGGLLAEELPPSLLREGRAMILALAADALAMPDCQLTLLWDYRLEPPELPDADVRIVSRPAEVLEEFRQLCWRADHTLLIAPETDGVLLELASAAVAHQASLLGASPELIHLCSDKHRTAELLQSNGIPAPHGMRLEAGESPPQGFPFPTVLKPIDGCGSQGLELLAECPADFRPRAVAARLEQYLPGQAASVAVLCGARQRIALPACWQQLSSDGSFAYLGGSTPIPAEFATRAEALARRAVDCLLSTTASESQSAGYLGVDMVLGAAADGSGDAVIEVNPRLTTSYVGLRQLVRENLLETLLRLAAGEEVAVHIHPGRIQFSADGQVTRDE